MGEFIKKLEKLKEFTLDVLYPRVCLGCGVEGFYLCQACLQKSPRLSPFHCPKCGLPLGKEAFCLRCEDTNWHLDSLHSVFRFEGFLRQAIHLVKYNNYKALAPVLAEEMYSFFKIIDLKGDAIIPVPLHPLRLKERGYNQSSLIAGQLGKLTGIPVIEGYLIRTVNTSPQVKALNREERIRNVQGAFSCKGQKLPGKSIILLDDVCTTGATLNVCASTLRRNQVEAVYALTLAREI